jgi:CubicO group peptidase (beta-lactamase class C family)
MSSLLEKKIKQDIDVVTRQDLLSFTPSMQLQVYVKGKKKVDLKWGEEYEFYDLASLTKILFTVPQFMRAQSESRLNVNDNVSEYLNWWPHKNIKIKSVLSHNAGLPWWAPLYENFKDEKIKYDKINNELALNKKHTRNSATGKTLTVKDFATQKEYVRKYMSGLELTNEKKAVYSDLDFILLSFLLEEVYEKPLIDIFASWPKRELLPSFHFNNLNHRKYAQKKYAPTENCPWRKKILQGEVHDDNTWALGGVSTHAGLFGSIDDVSQYGLLLRQALLQKSLPQNRKKGQAKISGEYGSAKMLTSPQLAQLFTKRAIAKARGDWALGYMMPSRGSASAGRFFSPLSVGHTGFTGTSFWYDPKKDLQVVLLSNRVNPTRDNKKFISLRPLVHEIIFQRIFKPNAQFNLKLNV